MVETKRLVHSFYYDLNANKIQKNSWNGGHSGWVMARDNDILRVRLRISNLITKGGWNLISIEPIEVGHFYADALTNNHGMGGGSSWGAGHGYGASATNGLLVTVEKTLPAAIVDQICEIRQRAADKIYEVRSEKIEEKKKVLGKDLWIFRGTEYTSWQAASDARETTAYQAYDAISEEAGLTNLLLTPPVETSKMAKG